jgi:hypothetical protein
LRIASLSDLSGSDFKNRRGIILIAARFGENNSDGREYVNTEVLQESQVSVYVTADKEERSWFLTSETGLNDNSSWKSFI